MNYVFTPPAVTSLSVVGSSERFAVRRIYCVARNYAEHAQEMGSSGREAPFFFLKPRDAIVAVQAGTTGIISYPSLTHHLHHEIELVAAIGRGGKNIATHTATEHIYGYAIGLDMTRRDLQNEAKAQGRPWCASKGFDESAPIGPITPAAQLQQDIHQATLRLQVTGQERQRGQVAQMIWSITEIVAQVSAIWELAPGDLIFTGTPAGVAAVIPGDTMICTCDGLETLTVRVE